MKPFFKIILIFLALKGIWCPSIAQTHVKNIYKLIDSAGEMGSQAKYEKAIVLFEKANKIIKDNKIKITDSFYLGKLINGAAMSYIEQGKIYAGVHDISKMKWHFDNAKKWWKIMLRDSTENISMLLFINGILANANNQLDNEEENMAILKEVQPYEAHLSLTNFFRYCMLLNSISSSLLQLGNTDSAANILINKEALLDTFINVYHVKQDAETGIYIEDIHLMLINQLAQVYQSKGDIINADRFYSKALNIIRKTKKIDEVTYLNVITFYDKKGEHKKSQELLDEVKNLIIKNEGKGTKRYLDILMAEADIYFDIGNFKKVLKILEEALPIATRSNEPRLVEFIYQLFGKAYFELEDIENGKKYYREIIKHHIAFFGKQSSKLPSLLIDFSLELQPFDLNYSFIIAKEAEGYVIKNKWEATQQALDIYSRLAHYYQWDYIKKGPIKKEKDKYLIDTAILYAQKAVALSEKYYSKTSFNHLQYLSNLASIVSIGNNNTQSLNINKQIIKTYEISSIVNRRFYAGQMLSVALDYNSLHKLDSTLFYLTKMITIVKEDIKDRNFKLFSSGYENYDFLNDKFNTADLYSYMLCDSIPGITQFSFNNQLFKKSVYLKNATYVLKNLRKRLNSNSEEALAGNQELLLEKQKNEIFKDVTWRDIEKKISKSEAVIEFASFYDEIQNKDIYYALLLQKNNKGPELIRLNFDSEKFNLKKLNVDSFYNYSLSGKLLFESIWQPIQVKIENATTIIISPIKFLHNINFSILPLSDDLRLADKFKIRIVSSSREILDSTGLQNFKGLKSSYFFGAINYDKASINSIVNANDFLSANIPSLISQQRGGYPTWEYLLGTKKEVQKIKEQFTVSNISSTLFTGVNATEIEIKKLSGKSESYILHIATHAFFFPDPTYQKPIINSILDKKTTLSLTDNPLFRSGLIMAGANKFWNKPANASDTTEDGILTAYEISNLDLSSCQLVVLSACETGLGDIKGSEGVFGLQRAFKLAGVKNIIMSLWKVPDEQTAELFELFYQNCFKGMSISEALSGAQSTMSKKYPPYYWAAFKLLE